MLNRFAVRPWSYLTILLGAAGLSLAWRIQSDQGKKTLDLSENPAQLVLEDKVQLTEALRLKETAGSLVWPGFDKAAIPFILYNERYEFLILHPDPPSSWDIVESDTFLNRSYYRRPSGNTTAYAVRIGDFWAGSLNTLSSMNESMEEQLREQVPPEKLTPVFMKMMSFTPAHHVAALLHEAFHAFQAMFARERFESANSVYKAEKEYPFENEDFQKAWRKEGGILASALRTEDESERKKLIREFLDARKERRTIAALSEESVAFERELEWLEGLAKYAEMRIAELGSTGEDGKWSDDYRIVRNRLRMDFYSRLVRLDEQSGDLRFYLSGAALAMLLDKTSPGWKREFLNRRELSLEDLF